VRVFSLCVLVIAAAACGGSGLFRQYEYEEDMYLRLDGSATIYVNTSIPALNALRGTALDARPTARVDREAIRQFFTTDLTRVVRVGTSRRRGRRFVHVRLEVGDVRKLSATEPFGWSIYQLRGHGDVVVYKQVVGAAAKTSDREPPPGWQGDELVAFRIHIPSVVEYHNAGSGNLRRGNILVWEQPLNDRLRGTPLELEVRMQPQSILYRTLILFASMFAIVALLFGVVIWSLIRKGRSAAPSAPSGRSASPAPSASSAPSSD
jgi:hypothetical protein